MAEEKRLGRPSTYRQSIARAICIRLMMGQSLNEICRLPGYPTKPTVFAWMHKHELFFNQYQRAREAQQETFLDDILEIADDGTNDWMERTNSEGDIVGWQINGEHVNRSKLRINTRQWIMERMAAKRYGAKKAIDHTSSDKSMSPKASIDPSKLSSQALEEIINAQTDE